MKAKPVSVRFEDELIQRVKACALRAGVGWQTMLKLLVATALPMVEGAQIKLPEGTRKKRNLPPPPEPPPPPAATPSGLSQEEINAIFEDIAS